MIRSWSIPIALCICTLSSAQHIDPITIYFESASDELTPAARTELESICDRNDIQDVGSIRLVGHADIRGNAPYNEDLSERRTKRVFDALSSGCINGEKIQMEWLGDHASHSFEEHALAADRRVEIIFIPDTELDLGDIHRHERIEPLMPNADVPRQHYVVDASLPIEFIAEDGVRVRIPGGAIVDASGRPVQGEVDITYRSFQTTSSILASGIPMHVGQGDDAGHMESLGMFEVYASQNGEQVFLKENEGISLTLPQEVERAEDYKDWMLDEATGEWVQSTPRIVANTTTVATNITEACLRYERLIAKMPAEPDTTVLLERMESIDYCGTVACSPATRPYDKRKNRYISPYATREIPAVQLQMVRRAYTGRPWIGFMIQVDHASLREWRAFPREMIWAYNGPLDNASFKRVITKKHFYQDIVLQLDENGTKGRIMLKDRGEWITLPVDLSVHQGTEKDLAKWNAQLASYEKAFEAKRVRFDDRVESKWKAVQTQRQRTISSSWQLTRERMNAEEMAMTMDEFHVYALQRIAQLRASQIVGSGDRSGVIQSFVMDGFGIYNCDRILPRESIQPVFVHFKDDSDQPFMWTHAYAVLGGQKAVISYWGNGSGMEPELKLSRKISHMVFVDQTGGMMIVQRPTDQITNSTATIKGRRIDQPKDPNELAELLATAR